MSLLDFIIFSEIIESTRGDSSGGGNHGCGCLVTVFCVVCLVAMLGKCGGSREKSEDRVVAPVYSGNYDAGLDKDKTRGVDTLHSSSSSSSSSINIEPYVPKPQFNATTIAEAREEGLDYGYDDGEEDGMNNEEDDSFDDSCPYSGKMAQAYKDGYQEGYENGWEDGLDEYNADRDPGEEEADW